MPTPSEIQATFDQAGGHFAAGQLREAELLLRQILTSQPDHAPSLHLLGLIAHQTGHMAAAADLMRKAVAAGPDEAEYHNHLGLVLLSIGQLDGAIAQFHKVIELEPDFADARNSLGAALKRKGNVEEAIIWYHEALRRRPAFPEALNNLGTALQEQGKLDESLACYRQAVEARPDYAEALSNLANGLRLKGEPSQSIEILHRAVSLRPDLPELHYNLGLALQSGRQFDQAAVSYRRALALRPEYPDALNNLGNVLEETPQFEQAIPIYRQVITLRPDMPEPHNNLGTVLKQTGQLDEAIAEYRQAIALRPDFVEALSNLGNALGEAGLLDEAEAVFQKALSVQPDYTEAAWNLGLLWLLRGDFERGWRSYESRNRDRRSGLGWIHHVDPGFMESFWKGEDLNSRRILLLAEQGLGDTIQFVRYASLVAGRGGRVLLHCQPRLKNLLAGQLGIEQIVAIGEEMPSFDLCCPLMSLPHLFCTRLDTIPADVPYLDADPARVGMFAQRIADLDAAEIRNPNLETRNKSEIQTGNVQSSSGLEHSNFPNSNSFRISKFEVRASGPTGGASRPLRVGLAWAGNPTYRNDRNRSIRLAALSPLTSVPNVRFFSLQKGPAAEQLRTDSIANRKSQIVNFIDWTSELTDLTDTAALIENLDLVISVDTAVAHLAGALGKPVWVLLPLTPDWRWMLGRSDSPWYPTMRLFRQPRLRDWMSPIVRMADELAKLLSNYDQPGHPDPAP